MLLKPQAYAILYALPWGQCNLIWLCHAGLLPCACAEELPCQITPFSCFQNIEQAA